MPRRAERSRLWTLSARRKLWACLWTPKVPVCKLPPLLHPRTTEISAQMAGGGWRQRSPPGRWWPRVTWCRQTWCWTSRRHVGCLPLNLSRLRTATYFSRPMRAEMTWMYPWAVNFRQSMRAAPCKVRRLRAYRGRMVGPVSPFFSCLISDLLGPAWNC